MEGYYWRFVHPEGVVVALCGVTRDGDGPAAARIAVATGPGEAAVVDAGPVTADPHTLGLDVPGILHASPSRLHVRLPGTRSLLIASAGPPTWSRRLGGLGLGGALPGVGQYWHPYVLGASASVVMAQDDRGARRLDGLLYAEKNWGPAFPGEWWWLQAHAGETALAVAGGVLRPGGLAVAATTLVLRHGDRVMRVSPPAGVVTARVGQGVWRFTARTATDRVDVEGHGDPRGPATLPLPPRPGERDGAHVGQHLAGEARLVWRRGRRLALDTVLAPAGMEHGRRRPAPSPSP